ncbi:MAG: class I SAM-dependent methyltransferase [Chloroflexota bacterium]
MTDAPTQHYTKEYFEKWNYADRGLGKFSMYWFARRYYAALVKRFAPNDGGKLLEMGCGLGHLLGLLQDDFRAVGIDLIDYSIEQTKLNAPKAAAYVMDVGAIRENFEAGSFSAIVALHLVEHLPDPQQTIRDVNHLLKPGGLFLYATPQPYYTLRRFKDHDTDAIGKDKTHINVHPPSQWRQWSETNGFEVIRQFGDGLWDVPYLPVIPKAAQFALFGLPALAQVLTQAMFTPLSMGVNQIVVTRKIAEVRGQ